MGDEGDVQGIGVCPQEYRGGGTLRPEPGGHDLLNPTRTRGGGITRKQDPTRDRRVPVSTVEINECRYESDGPRKVVKKNTTFVGSPVSAGPPGGVLEGRGARGSVSVNIRRLFPSPKSCFMSKRESCQKSTAKIV